MALNSFLFVVFFMGLYILTAIESHFFRGNLKVKNAIFKCNLLLGSYLLIVYINWHFAVVMTVIAVVTYICTIGIEKHRKKSSWIIQGGVYYVC